MSGFRRALADHVDEVLLFGGIALAALGGSLGSEVLGAVGGVVFLAAIFLSDFLADVLAPDAEAAETSADDDAADPVAVLRERYADGEIDEAEFERRLERLLATEDGPAGEATGERESERARR
jgi:uncharacterized membrane protein